MRSKNEWRILKNFRLLKVSDKVLMRHQLSENAESQDVQPIFSDKKANSLNSKTAEILTYILQLHMKVPNELNLQKHDFNLCSIILVKPDTHSDTEWLPTYNKFMKQNTRERLLADINHFTICPIHKCYKTTKEKQRAAKKKRK